jgi:hypothetical protein
VKKGVAREPCTDTTPLHSNPTSPLWQSTSENASPPVKAAQDVVECTETESRVLVYQYAEV